MEAARTDTPTSASTPSSWQSNWLTTRSAADARRVFGTADYSLQARASRKGNGRWRQRTGDTGRVLSTAPRDGFKLIEEKKTRPRGGGAGEQIADGGLRRADVFVEELGALDGQKRERTLRGERGGEQRFAAARRAVQQHA